MLPPERQLVLLTSTSTRMLMIYWSFAEQLGAIGLWVSHILHHTFIQAIVRKYSYISLSAQTVFCEVLVTGTKFKCCD